MGKVMSKEQDARDLALREYNTFMEKYKQGVEAGNMKLMQHMLKLEADKMKLQMNSDEYRKDQAREEAFIKMATKDTTQETQEKQPLISIGDPDEMQSVRMDAMDFGQISKPVPKVEKKQEAPAEEEQTGIIVDPKTGKKTYKGPKLRSRKVVDGKEWDSSHPSYLGKSG